MTGIGETMSEERHTTSPGRRGPTGRRWCASFAIAAGLLPSFCCAGLRSRTPPYVVVSSPRRFVVSIVVVMPARVERLCSPDVSTSSSSSSRSASVPAHASAHWPHSTTLLIPPSPSITTSSERAIMSTLPSTTLPLLKTLTPISSSAPTSLISTSTLIRGEVICSACPPCLAGRCGVGLRRIDSRLVTSRGSKCSKGGGGIESRPVIVIVCP